MAYTYGQGLGNTGAAYNLWGTPSGSPNPYYSAGPSYTPSLFDYSMGQPQAQTQQNTQSLTPMNRPTEDMTAKEMAWWAERLGLGGLLRMGSTDGSGVPIEDRIIGGQESPFLSPDAQRAQTFDAQRPFLSPDAQRAQTFDAQYPAVMDDSTNSYIESLLQEAPFTTNIWDELSIFDIQPTDIRVQGPALTGSYPSRDDLEFNTGLYL